MTASSKRLGLSVIVTGLLRFASLMLQAARKRRLDCRQVLFDLREHYYKVSLSQQIRQRRRVIQITQTVEGPNSVDRMLAFDIRLGALRSGSRRDCRVSLLFPARSVAT